RLLHSFPTRRSSDLINRDRVEDATKFLEVGQEVEAKIINVDRKSRAINLSIKAKDEAEEKEAVANLKTAPAGQDNGPKTIGDLIDRKSTRLNSSHVK